MADMSNLFALMAERGIKAAQLSRDTGISTGLISDWKKGTKKPAAKNLKILCDYFDVDEAFIMGYTDTPKAAAGLPAEPPEESMPKVYFSIAQNAKNAKLDQHDVDLINALIAEMMEQKKRNDKK